MRGKKQLGCDASFIPVRYAKNPRQVLRRYRPVLPPSVNRDGLHPALRRDLLACPGLVQQLLDCLFHVSIMTKLVTASRG